MNEIELEKLAKTVDRITIDLDVVGAREQLKLLIQNGIHRDDVGSIGVLYRQLMFVRLPQLSIEETIWLFQYAILEGVSIDNFNLFERTADALSILMDEEDRYSALKRIITAVDEGVEKLGTNLLVIDKAKFDPTVRNWLKDYSIWLSGRSRESLSELNYVNQSSNAKNLEGSNRQLLLALLGFYDFLNASLHTYENLPTIYVEEHPEIDFSAADVTDDELYEFRAGNLESRNSSEINTGSRVVARDDKTNTGYTPDESANVQGRLSEMQESKDEVGLNMGGTNEKDGVKLPIHRPVEEAGIQTREILRSDDLLRMTENRSRQKPQSIVQSRKALPPQPEEKLLRAPTLADIKAEAEEKKRKVQADIERKLTSLRSKK